MNAWVAYLGALIGGAVVSAVLTRVVAAWALRRGLLDLPGGRHVHASPVPRLGGVAVLLGLTAGALAYGAVFGWGPLAETVGRDEFIAFLAPCLLVFAVGLLDDLRGLGPAPRVLVEAVAAGFLVQAGYVIDVVATPWGEPFALGPFATPVTILWLVGVTNAHNLIDGLDGLLGAVGTAALLGCAAVAILGNRPASAILALALAGSLLGFLVWNWHPARIFLGDCGSLTVGFAVGALSLKVARNHSGSLSFHVPLLLCAIPLIEVALTLARRHVSGARYFEGDQSHVHHVLLARGHSIPRISASLGLAAALLAATAAFARSWRNDVAFAAIVVLVLLAALALRWLGYVELAVLGQRLLRGGLRRGAGRGGLPDAAALARLARGLAGAGTREEVRAAIASAAEALGLARVLVHLAPRGSGAAADEDASTWTIEPDRLDAAPAEWWAVRVAPAAPGPVIAVEVTRACDRPPLDPGAVRQALAEPLQAALARVARPDSVAGP